MASVDVRRPMRFVCRSYMAVVLTPEPPIVEWLAGIAERIKGAETFLAGAPVVLDLSAVQISKLAIVHLISELEQRGIRILGVENIDPANTGADLPPILQSSQTASVRPDKVEPTVRDEPKKSSTLLIDQPIRSGQSIIFPDGDLTVLGSVASGAELVAGGSIHVYGTLRGRASAGAQGNTAARIFCRRNEAELLSVDGWYCTAEEMDPSVRGKPVQAFLDNGMLRIAPFS